MIKTYATTVKAEVFDGSKEMMSRYPIRHFVYDSKLLGRDENWYLDIPSRYTKGQTNPSKLLKGQYIVTTPSGKVINMWPDDFEDLYPEAEK